MLSEDVLLGVEGFEGLLAMVEHKLHRGRREVLRC